MAAKHIFPDSHSTIVAYLFTDEKTDCRFQFVNETTKEVKEFRGHSNLLAALSPVFRAMFSDNWNESRNPIKITDASHESFSTFMEYFYKNSITLTPEDAVAILHLADKYDVKPLVDHCETFLMEQLTTENGIAYYQAAVRYERDQLKTVCLNLFRARYDTI